MSKLVMICIGKAGQDIFLEGDVFKPVNRDGELFQEVKLGGKFYVDNATFSTGGNAPNAAVTFARQGAKVSFISVVGDDPAGEAITKVLDSEFIDTSKVLVDPALKSSFSNIMLAPSGERTILDYPGTAFLKDEHIDFDKLDSDWLYVSSVGSMPLITKIMKRAFENGVKIAFNPASYELKNLQECADLLQYVTLFAVNKEEAQLFVDGETIQELATNLSGSVHYALVSDGPNGSVATDGERLVTAGMYEDVPVVDRTGAGDSFTSGFIVRIARGESLECAITFASANSTSVVGAIGAKTNILKGDVELKDMPLQITNI